MSNFSNPIGSGLTPARIDQGVDYEGKGPLYAIGDGTIVNTTNAGWPGGTFLTIHLDSGQYVYYAEWIQPLVKVGDKVKAGQHIANATGTGQGIEIGFASPPGTGGTMAQQAGQSAKSGDPGANTTAYGQLMSNLIHSLGGPAGLHGGPNTGSVPSSFGISAAGITTTAQDVGGSLGTGLLGIPSQITDFFTQADTLVKALMWLAQPSSWVRIGAFIAGVALLLFAIHALISAAKGEPIVSMPTVVPVPV